MKISKISIENFSFLKCWKDVERFAGGPSPAGGGSGQAVAGANGQQTCALDDVKTPVICL
jgi:hypothetical protein